MTRAPANLLETVTANFRPQPAIPALLLLLLCGLYFRMATAPVIIPVVDPASGSAAPGLSVFGAWGITVGLLISCALAVAAGFCSLFPMFAWIALSLLLFGTRASMLPTHGWLALYTGIVVAAAMVAVQLWRIRTGRFVPTISDDPQEHSQ
ncbi:MAG: hypothetical protein R3F24_10705 [Gammaproteobacteria bacterium]